MKDITKARRFSSRVGLVRSRSMAVTAIDADGIHYSFNSCTEAARSLSCNPTSLANIISAYKRGKRKSTFFKGFFWYYTNDEQMKTVVTNLVNKYINQ